MKIFIDTTLEISQMSPDDLKKYYKMLKKQLSNILLCIQLIKLHGGSSADQAELEEQHTAIHKKLLKVCSELKKSEMA